MRVQGIRASLSKCALVMLLLFTALESKADADDGERKSVFILVDAESGDPIEGASLKWQLYGTKLRNEQNTRSNADGKSVVRYPVGKDVRLWVTIRSPDHHPEFYGLSKAASSTLIPSEIRVEMRRGVPTTGSVVDESGKPIADVKLEVYGPAPNMNHFYYELRSCQSDKNGRFLLGAIDPDFSKSIRIEHPDFIDQFVNHRFGEPLKATLVASQVVAGTVVDFRNRPIPGASILLGQDRFGRDEHRAVTDETGRFTLKGVTEFPIRLTITAEKHSPQTREFDETEANNCDFKLLPGRTIRFEIIDVKGKPIQGVRVLSDTWQNVRTLVLDTRTDQNGRVSFRNAPSDEVEYHILKGGYRAIRDAILTATKEPHRIVMRRPTKVHGKVLDDASDQPIDRFTVTGGYTYGDNDYVSWRDWETSVGSDGSYEHREDEYPDGFIIKISADGYEPWISAPISDDGTAEWPSVTMDARLKRLAKEGEER